MSSMFLVIESCPDSIILNNVLPEDQIRQGTLECWAPDGTLYLVTIRDIAGSIVEIDKIIHQGKYVQEVPVGSFIYLDSIKAQWFICRYYSGEYDDMIVCLMEKFGITDYKLPYYRTKNSL